MKPRNVDIELEVASVLLVTKKFLDMGGTTSQQFKEDLRTKIDTELAQKAPDGPALDPDNKKTTISMDAQRPYGARNAKFEFEFSLHLETRELILQKMVMELNSKPGQPLVWQKSSGQKLPASDKAFFLIEGKKHQERKDGIGRQIKGGYYSNRRRT